MKKIILLILIIGVALFTTACGSKNGYKVVNCTRDVEGQEGLTAKMDYKLYYKGKYIKKMTSVEELTFKDENILKEYKKGYEKAYKPYEEIEYYDHTLTKKGKTLTSKVDIDYTKIDMDKLIELEGEEDNIYEDGKIPLKKAIKFYKSAGIKCDYDL